VRYYTVSAFTHIKAAIAEASRVQFKLKDYRATFAQRCIDLDPNLLTSVSRALGHKSSLTTETFYARIGEAPAIKQIQDAWEKVAVAQAPKPQFPLIERKEWLTGYA
jgi:integrase